jgi:acyl carrier protein
MSENFKRLQYIVGQQLGVPTIKIKPETHFTQDLDADSLDVVELVMAIENEFEIEIEDQIASQIATIQDALNYIQEKE